jgi:hypothetical protein
MVGSIHIYVELAGDEHHCKNIMMQVVSAKDLTMNKSIGKTWSLQDKA